MGSMIPFINMLGPRLLLKPNILTMGKLKAPIFITDLVLELQLKPKSNAIMGKPKAPISLTAYPLLPSPGQLLLEKAVVADGMRGEMEVMEGYEARGVPNMSSADGDDRDDGAMDLLSSERAALMAEFLARLGESLAVQVIGARAGMRSVFDDDDDGEQRDL